jgi:hypothetical protein
MDTNTDSEPVVATVAVVVSVVVQDVIAHHTTVK